MREYVVGNLLLLVRSGDVNLSQHFQELLKFYIDMTSQNIPMMIFDIQLCHEISEQINLEAKDVIPILDMIISIFYSNITTGPFFL